MCEITSVRYDDSGHRKRNIQDKLTNWGYEFDFPPRGNVTITRKPESSEEKLKEILLRRLKLDSQINPLHFACFIFAFQDIEGFASMPWEERAMELQSHYGVSVSDRTLRNWCSQLLEKALIAKVEDRTCWKTEIMNGRTSVLSQRFDSTAFKKVMPDVYKAYIKQVMPDVYKAYIKQVSSKRFSIA